MRSAEWRVATVAAAREMQLPLWTDGIVKRAAETDNRPTGAFDLPLRFIGFKTFHQWLSVGRCDSEMQDLQQFASLD
jgi:hypothetical protein